jgi:hypothetical protein
MAFIYLAGGRVLRVSQTREAIEKDLHGPRSRAVLTYEVGVPAGGAQRAMPVTVLAANIAAVSDERLPNPP